MDAATGGAGGVPPLLPSAPPRTPATPTAQRATAAAAGATYTRTPPTTPAVAATPTPPPPGDAGWSPMALASPGAAAARPVAIVTGANTGVGFETAAGLVAAGYDVVVACRSDVKAAAAVERLNAAAAARGHTGRAAAAHLDLADLRSVVACVARFRERYAALHALVLNAGMNISLEHVGDARKTVDGFEICMQTNYLGHYLLARLLLRDLLTTGRRAAPTLNAAGVPAPPPPVRLVTLGSVAHRLVTSHRQCDWGACFVGLVHYTYNASKLACMMLAYELQRRFRDDGVTAVAAVAVNPGAVASDIWRHLPRALRTCLHPLMAAAFLTPAQGAVPVVAAATARVVDGVDIVGGEYLTPYRHHCAGAAPLALVWDAIGPFAGACVARSSDLSYNPALWSSLWAMTEAALAAHLPPAPAPLLGDAGTAKSTPASSLRRPPPAPLPPSVVAPLPPLTPAVVAAAAAAAAAADMPDVSPAAPLAAGRGQHSS